MDTCDPLKKIALTSAKNALGTAQSAMNSAQNDYNQSCGPATIASAALQSAQGDVASVDSSVEVIQRIQKIVLNQLGNEASSSASTLKPVVEHEIEKVQTEIEELRSEIRKERRLFLDADPSATTAVAGLYYTREPDNQVLIAFLVCFGTFLLTLGLLVFLRLIPLQYFIALDGYGESGFTERLKLVGSFWLISLVVAFAGFYGLT
jgi:hypothetical protein